MKPEEIEAKLERILPSVQKPGRYTGGELNQVVKDWAGVKTRLALVFPDIYDIGMSNLGMTILYESVNQRPDALAERAYSPWSDMEAALRQAGVPLYSLETHHALADFDIVGFSLPYETLYTNTLNVLDLAGIPLFAAERTSQHPLVIAGGHSTYNPEPMHAFIDAFVIGEGEEVIHEILDAAPEMESQPRPAPGAAGEPGANLGCVRTVALCRPLHRRWRIRSHREAGRKRPAAGGQTRCGQAAAAPHPLYRPIYRYGAQPGAGGDHARLHAWLPFLPRRDDQPPGARAPGG